MLLTHQEGATLPGGGRPEFKGVAMKKSVVTKSTREFLTASVEARLLRPDRLDRAGMIMDVVELEARVLAAAEAGSAEFATPMVLGRVAGYAAPYRMPVVRGAAAWNAAVPGNPVRESDRVNAFRVRVGSDAHALLEAARSHPEGSEGRVALEAVAAAFFGEGADPELSRAGFNWVCAPKDLRRLPAWLAPLVDARHAADSNVAPALPVLEAVGARPLTHPDPEAYSTTIAF